MPIPTTPAMQALAAKAIKNHMIEQERTLRELLGQWVSGLEPTVIYRWPDAMHIVGIGIKDDPTGTVVIANPKCPPESWFRTLLRATPR